MNKTLLKRHFATHLFWVRQNGVLHLQNWKYDEYFYHVYLQLVGIITPALRLQPVRTLLAREDVAGTSGHTLRCDLYQPWLEVHEGQDTFRLDCREAEQMLRAFVRTHTLVSARQWSQHHA